MAILFRIDVDKPFGHYNLLSKVASKLSEDYGIHLSNIVPYLKHCKAMLAYLNEAQVPAFFYFRNCSKPDAETKQLLLKGYHLAGFHAEDTRNIETFKTEFDLFCKEGMATNHFTKHGSGVLKLGRHHYPPYEPEKYLEWAEKSGLLYFTGNNIATTKEALAKNEAIGFWPSCFWVEENYRDKNFNSLDEFLNVAVYSDVVLLTHPENFYTHQKIRNDIAYIISKAKEKGIGWINSLPN